MNWSEQSFISYLKAVDDTLEAYYGCASDQDEFETIAKAHAENIPPETIAKAHAENIPPETIAFRLKASEKSRRT